MLLPCVLLKKIRQIFIYENFCVINRVGSANGYMKIQSFCISTKSLFCRHHKHLRFHVKITTTNRNENVKNYKFGQRPPREN